MLLLLKISQNGNETVYRLVKRILVGKWDISQGAMNNLESLIWRIIVLLWLLDKAGILGI